MKRVNTTILLLFSTLFFISCGGGSSNQEATAEGFSNIEKDIKDEFGNDAYFTDLSILYNETIGNSISTTVTDDPETLKMGEWVQSQGDWKQTSEVMIEIPEGTKASDFMFQLDETINLKKLGELVENSKVQLTKEKNIENPKLHIASVKFPNNGDVSKAQYVVMLQPENGGTTFSFFYTLTGELTDFNY